MGEGHIPSDAIIEMIRIVKPGTLPIAIYNVQCPGFRPGSTQTAYGDYGPNEKV